MSTLLNLHFLEFIILLVASHFRCPVFISPLIDVLWLLLKPRTFKQIGKCHFLPSQKSCTFWGFFLRILLPFKLFNLKFHPTATHTGLFVAVIFTTLRRLFSKGKMVWDIHGRNGFGWELCSSRLSKIESLVEWHRFLFFDIYCSKMAQLLRDCFVSVLREMLNLNEWVATGVGSQIILKLLLCLDNPSVDNIYRLLSG